MTTGDRREPPPTGVRVCERPGRGLRVVAARPFAPGEQIERAPVVDFPEQDRELLAGTVLLAHAFPADGGGGGVALGYGALYERSPAPSASCAFHAADRVLEIVAERGIEAEEEITVEGEPLPPAPVASGVIVGPPAGVTWGPSPGRGLGVFAARDLDAGETIERSPCITFPETEWSPIEKSRFDDYCFVWGSTRKDGALPLGYGALYNHSFEPNATYVRHLDEHVMDFVAIRDIAAGQEIRTNYNRDPLDMSPVWFDIVA